jgi:sugar/nucleoside kinase (ribokinase family)
MKLGPKFVVIKKGEHGSLLCIGNEVFVLPAYPADKVIDPTGAGDSFAGGFFGYIASQPELTPAVFKRAMFYGGVMGSFTVERFGTERLQHLTREEIEERFAIFRELTHLD